MKRNHYIPQHYLKGFSTPDGGIFRYEKGSGKVIYAALDKVGLEKGFYSDKIEQRLSDEIESPAGLVFDKIKQQQEITPDEKLILATYMINLMKRVPHGFERAKTSLWAVIEDSKSEIRAQLIENPGRRREIEAEFERLLSIERALKKDVPRELWYPVIEPDATPKAVDALFKMIWQFNVADKPAFITSDNPFYYDLRAGLGGAETIVSIPISSYIALEASWMVAADRKYFPTNREIVGRINGRTIQTASRYIFQSENDPILSSLLTDKTAKSG